MYENSIKVPFLVSHPRRIPENRAQNAMVSSYDFMPTLLDYLGLPLPENRNLPGQSVLSTWLGESDAGREEVVVYDEYGNTRMVRTEAWKYVHRHPDGPHELYDLKGDPDERCNLTDDLSQSTRITELKARLESWFTRYVDPDKDGHKFDVTGNGQMRPVGQKWNNGSSPFSRD
jgi:arylsulfatase A-like enzyme